MQTQTLPDGTQIVLIHYTNYVGGLSHNWRIACMPNMKDLNSSDALQPNYQRTNDKRAVTCPACKRSSAFTGTHHDVNEPPK